MKIFSPCKDGPQVVLKHLPFWSFSLGKFNFFKSFFPQFLFYNFTFGPWHQFLIKSLKTSLAIHCHRNQVCTSKVVRRSIMCLTCFYDNKVMVAFSPDTPLLVTVMKLKYYYNMSIQLNINNKSPP